MDPVKVYIVGKQKADVVCPSCDRANAIILADADMSLNCEIDCTCGSTIPVIFEKRRSFRKRVLLTGTCFCKSDPPGGVTVKILNLSRSGMQFQKDAGEKPELNETIRLRFKTKLSGTVIRCIAVVKNIDENKIGVRFLNLDLNLQKLIDSQTRY
jgi:hypothetical protein